VTVLIEPSSTTTDDATTGRSFASGPLPYRVLLVGPASTTGDAASRDALAQGLADRTGHGVDVETVLARPLSEAADGRLLADRDLSRIDAVIVALDPEHSRRAVPSTRDTAVQLLRRLGERLTAGSALVVVVPAASVAGVTAGQADDIAAAMREAADSLTPVVQLEEGGAERWAPRIAEATAGALIDPMVDFLPDDHYDEDLRLDAVDRLPPRDGLWVARFQRIVDEARAAYGTDAAALSIVDADHSRYGVTVGFENKVIKRGQTICNRVLRTYGGLIVGDAMADLRFHRNPDVRSGDVRFYAGYRIESIDGAPLGSLCVFDPTPRTVADQDLVVLRDLAISAQRDLWRFQAATA
jgi:hypothetical protein